MNKSTPSPSLVYPARVILLVVTILLVVLATIGAIAYATDICLILFLAILFGVFLTKASHFLDSHTPLNYAVSLGLIPTLLVACSVFGAWRFGVQMNDQIVKASEHLDEAQVQLIELSNKYPLLKSTIEATPFVRELINGAPDAASQKKNANSDQPSSETNKSDTSQSDRSGTSQSLEQSALQSTAQRGVNVIGSVFKTTLGLVINSMVIFFVGLFLASNPESYRDGVVVLFPPHRRNRVRELMNMMGDTLWKWLIGRFGSMLVTGGGAGVLLLSLGVPMAVTLGFITGLLTFVPNLGGFLALILAILFALPKGGMVVVLVLIGYLVLQLIESYLVTPLIQKHQVSIPPALLIAVQALMGVLFGMLGAAVASPLLAVTKLGVEEAYVKDVLESGTTEA